MCKEIFEANQFGKRNLNFENHWEALDLEQYEVIKPVLICLGGNGTIDPAKCTRFCATAERFMGLKSDNYDDVDLIGVHYTKNSETSTIGSLNNEQRNCFADNIFMKLCVGESGERLPIEAVAKRFSYINIFTHCWGAREMSQIGNLVENKMRKLGYSADEIKFAFSQIFHITYAPYCDHTCFPCLRINSFIDSENKGLRKEYITAYKQDLDGVDLKCDRAGYFRGVFTGMSKFPILSIYSSQLVNTEDNSDLRSILDEHAIDILERNTNWTQGHQSRCAKNADLVSKMVSYVVAEVVAKSTINSRSDELVPKPSVEDFYNALTTFLRGCNYDDLKSTIHRAQSGYSV